MEQEKNNKGVVVLLVIIIVILLALVVLLATGTISFKNNSKNENQQSNISNYVDEDGDNTNEGINGTNTEPIKGEIVENTNNVAEWIREYSSLTNYKVSKEFCGPPVPTSNFVFEIKNGILSLTNEDTGDSATLDGITNFKSMAYVQLYTSCYSYSIYLLTDDGKLYESIIPLNEINSVDNLKNIFRLIDLPIKVNKIGIIKTKDVPATSEEVLLKDDNNIEYYGDGSKYFKIS